MSTPSDTGFLSDLATAHSETAWQTFLRTYSSLILRVVRHHAKDERRVMDIYLFVCEKLSESRFRRLRKFRTDGSATFSTWLTTVIRNLCVDWHRSAHGRRRPPASLSRMSKLESFVFREMYECGRSKTECLNSLPERFGHVTESELYSINARIHSLLTPARRWQLANRFPTVVPLDERSESDAHLPTMDENDNPLLLALSAEQAARLEQAIAALDVDERLAIRLRFQEDLSLEQVARVVGLGSKYRVRLLINGALSKIRQSLTD
ncbi:MAG: sigma-70 family RNA polymerase sigma factor [Woeseiaceae bacterium]|nr:sigma-70 family RNA polymerase sigma factor [Woeseiaceae bacterium]